jgi:hypothetical protein
MASARGDDEVVAAVLLVSMVAKAIEILQFNLTESSRKMNNSERRFSK